MCKSEWLYRHTTSGQLSACDLLKHCGAIRSVKPPRLRESTFQTAASPPTVRFSSDRTSTGDPATPLMKVVDHSRSMSGADRPPSLMAMLLMLSGASSPSWLYSDISLRAAAAFLSTDRPSTAVRPCPPAAA